MKNLEIASKIGAKRGSAALHGSHKEGSSPAAGKKVFCHTGKGIQLEKIVELREYC